MDRAVVCDYRLGLSVRFHVSGMEKEIQFRCRCCSICPILRLDDVASFGFSYEPGGGWDSITSEAMIGSYVAAISLAVYGVVRVFLQREIGSLEADRFSAVEELKQSEILVRSIIIVLSFMSFILPFAVEYNIYHYGQDMEASLSVVYHWFGGVGEYNMPLWFLLIFPIIYLPLIMMCLGVKRTRFFNNGVRLLIIYWVWHLLFFVHPFYRAELGSYEQITVPSVGIIFFPTIILLYTMSYVIARINRRHEPSPVQILKHPNNDSD
jgi:hypothetical protein